MADTKISALPASTTPLAGTEVLPIVQSGATKQVSVANLTAGRALSATELTLTTGNLVIGTAGKGIDFSADPSAAGMTSELLDDYEEGTWIPSLGGTTTYSQQGGTYTKVGRIVHVEGRIIVSNIGTGSATTVSGLPFTVFNAPLGFTSKGVVGYFAGIATACTYFSIDPFNNSTSFIFNSTAAAVGTATNAPAIFGNGTRVDFSLTYTAA
jgi:hypothetical protein